MGSINKRPLNAYVRYDASGRVVAGSLVLRRKIPKNGNWKQLPDNIAYECCYPTTTTTSSSTTTAAPLPAANYSEAGDASNACSETINTAAGKFKCLKVEPLLKGEGIFKQKGRLLVWMTDDEYKIPVQMTSEVAVGHITSELEKIEGIKGKIPSRISD